MLTVDYDDVTGIITTVAAGLSSVADFDHYLPILAGLIERSTSMHGKWLHLVDCSANPVQPRESTEHVTNAWNAKPRENGYTAYVLTSALAKMQIQRMRENANKAFFADTDSARIWLLSQVGDCRQASAG